MSEISGADLLDAVARFIRRFVRLAESQITAITLWVLHTHTLDGVAFTPYISVTSPEKQSGKSTLCEVLVLLVPKPWYTGRVTAAVLTRKVDAEKPTLLLDESDAAFNGNKEYAEALRGILNSGFTQNGTASCCVGQGGNTTYKDFKTFCPKLIAGIGRLPDTVADRSIPIRLQRATPEERKKLEKFRHRTAKFEGDALGMRIEQWASQNTKASKLAQPECPDGWNGRQEDVAEPLLAIADLAGGAWPQKVRAALASIWSTPSAEDPSTGVQLLLDIRSAFDEKGVEKLSTRELLEGLNVMECSPWPEWTNGKPMTPTGLARLLKKYDIAPRTIRLDEASTCKGYLRESFGDVWERYARHETSSMERELIGEPSHASQTIVYAGLTPLPESSQTETAAGRKSEESPVIMRPVTDVTDQGQSESKAQRVCFTHPSNQNNWWLRAGTDPVCGICHPDPNCT